MWNSTVNWKTYQNLWLLGGWNSSGRSVEKTENFNSWGWGGWCWLLNCFSLFFSNQESYSVNKICLYSKIKIKTKVTNKQNLEHFKIINRRLFIHKFCNNWKMLLLSSWAIFISMLVFSFSPTANFSLFE